MFGFTTALSYLMQGKRVRRSGWHEGWIEVSGDSIIDDNDDDFFEVENSESILADDWELVN